MTSTVFSFFKVIALCFVLLTVSCNNAKQKKVSDVEIKGIDLPERPNILWLVTEDMSAYLPSFGDSTIVTPNLSRLAKEGVIYPNLYSTSGVCAPSRAAITTGMYPSSIGANHMRTTSFTEVTGLPAYGAVPPPEVKMISELLRKEGYYCTNNYKTDYQFKHPVTAWDESGPYAHWRNRSNNQPFFSVVNFTETHESGLFEPYGHRYIEQRHYRLGDRSFKWKEGRMSEEETPKHLKKDTKFNIPPYLPKTEVVQRDMWKMYNNIAEMDSQVGAVLKQLEDDGLLENTIIFFYGDHGGPMPRQKRLIYDSGLNTPMIVRFPNQINAGTKDDRLLSFVDFAPTLLSLIKTEPHDYMQGQAFLGEYSAKNKREYIYAAADRFDGFTDAIRAVRNNRFKYIRNYRPEQGYYLPIDYRENIPTMQELLNLRDAGELDSVQSLWFGNKKPMEELYDCIVDPHEINNLAENPEYAEILNELSNELDNWINNIGDQPNLPEGELLKQLWNGKNVQPITLVPTVDINESSVSIACNTEGASIGYKVIKSNKKEPVEWQVYTGPFELQDNSTLKVQAHRIGFKPSDIVVVNK